MPSVRQILERLFPTGTNPNENNKDYAFYPPWPPDLFAACASLVERSGCYSHPRYAGGFWCESFYEHEFSRTIQQAAQQWNKRAVTELTYTTTAATTEVIAKDTDSTDSVCTSVNKAHVTMLDQLSHKWRELINCHDEIQAIRPDEPPPTWCDHALWLLAVADEASAGIGFFAPVLTTNGRDYERVNHFVEYWTRQYTIWDCVNSLEYFLSHNVLTPDRIDTFKSFIVATFDEAEREQYLDLLNTPNRLYEELKNSIGLPYLPSSLCRMVPASEICVQPKTRTSEVGCTLRSLSHHLALLPSVSQVEPLWRVASRFKSGSDAASLPQALNLLLVPFPYTVQGNSFIAGKPCVGSHLGNWDEDGVNKARFFSVTQKWLQRADNPQHRVTHRDISTFLRDLISQARREVDQVHGLILPELALSYELARDVVEDLRLDTDLELFICGVLSEARSARGPKNSVYTWVMKDEYKDNGTKEHVGSIDWEQSKHHRWKIEKYQISKYHLGGRLDPHIDWWEHIDISPRQCHFGVFRHEACLTALVCEDLARIDPVQTAIRSIGPNLVVALLMDGAQAESRWSGRYATVLADDPGCAVITLTSMGLLRRSTLPEKAPALCQIALWKEAGGDRAVELSIPADHHALLLTLSYKTKSCFTIEGRSDVTRTVTLSRSGTYPIKHPGPLDWMDW